MTEKEKMQACTTDEAIAAAKAKIAEEFLSRYREFLADVKDGGSNDFGRKYGFTLTEEGIKQHSKDTLKNLCWYQRKVFSGRYVPDWEKAGYSRYTIWELGRRGFLSNQEYSNWQARMTGRTSFYYISQQTAKEIYKASKA